MSAPYTKTEWDQIRDTSLWIGVRLLAIFTAGLTVGAVLGRLL